MRSDNIKNTEEKAEITEVSAVDSDVKKQRFGLKIFPETLEMVDTLFEYDNCKSRSEFIEKAVRFYCGYLLNKESTATEFIAPLRKLAHKEHGFFSFLISNTISLA